MAPPPPYRSYLIVLDRRPTDLTVEYSLVVLDLSIETRPSPSA